MFKKAFYCILGLMILMSFPASMVADQMKDTWEMDPVLDFQASEGDQFIADLENGMGYLVNEERQYFTTFQLLSGQKRNVCYIGRCYFAATPEQTWVVKEENIQGDRVTFSESGEFFRMFEDDSRTSYGIHGYKYFQDNIDKGKKFVSMGCLLVADDVLDVIEASFVANGEELTVITKKEVPTTSLLSNLLVI